jgi:hypothetical protein
MLRRAIAVGSAALLAFTVTTARLSATDMGLPATMPTKAPPLVQPVEEFVWWPYAAGAVLIGAGLLACFEVCGCLKDCQCNSPPC